MHTCTETAAPASAASAEAAPFQLRGAVRSDVGIVRERNEDAAYVDPDGQFFIVADGMGGHVGGAVASAMAVDVVRQELEASRQTFLAHAAAPSIEGRQTVCAVLELAVRAAHQAVQKRAQREMDKHGMGTTLDVALVIATEVFVAHVGDSRTYLVREGVATQITRDHTIAQVMRNSGKSTEEVQALPKRNVLLSAIGVKDGVTVDVVHRALQSGDRLLLCSDGLYQYFAAQEIASRLSSGAPDEALRELVMLARTRGGEDNITGLVVEVLTRRPRAPTVRRSSGPPPVPPARRPRPPGQVPRDRLEDQPTRPHSSGQGPTALNPLMGVSEDDLCALVEHTLHEQSQPLSSPRATRRRALGGSASAGYLTFFSGRAGIARSHGRRAVPSHRGRSVPPPPCERRSPPRSRRAPVPPPRPVAQETPRTADAPPRAPRPCVPRVAVPTGRHRGAWARAGSPRARCARRTRPAAPREADRAPSRPPAPRRTAAPALPRRRGAHGADHAARAEVISPRWGPRIEHEQVPRRLVAGSSLGASRATPVDGARGRHSDRSILEQIGSCGAGRLSKAQTVRDAGNADAAKSHAIPLYLGLAHQLLEESSC